MRRIRWTFPAVRQLQRIADYIRERNPSAERDFLDAVVDALENVREFPFSAKSGQKAGTRELVIAAFPAYIVVYRVTDRAVEILNLWHAAQDWQQ